MPLRQRPDLWANLPGVVAAYQPVRAPGPLLARYNMAHGGDNRYRATDETPPTWSGAAGWTFNGSNQQLLTGIVPVNNQLWTMLVAFSGLSSVDAHRIIAGFYSWTGVETRFGLCVGYGVTRVVPCSGGDGTATQMTQGVAGVSGAQGYANGVGTGAIATVAATWTTQIALGSGYGFRYTAVNIRAVMIAPRPLAESEVWQASRQMQYCDVNPDWSVWGRRRQWFYRSTEIVASTIYRRRVPALIRTGTRGEML